MGWGLPSWSDVKNAASSTLTSATNSVTRSAATVRDLSASAVARTTALASDGVDIARRAVNAVRTTDVREAAHVVRQKISEGTEAAHEGIKTGVEWSSKKTGEVAAFARAHVPGGNNIVSNAVRGAITTQENLTRFSIGAVGGVSREVVGLAGAVGQLSVTATEMQLSPEARVEYGQKIVNGTVDAAHATGRYVESVVNNPSRLGDDISGAAGAVKDWGGGQLARYEAAFRAGKGYETVGMDVGTVATYVVPVGGGPVRGALTTAVRGGTEATVRGGVEAIVRGGAELATREGAEALAPGLAGGVTKASAQRAAVTPQGQALTGATGQTRLADRLAQLEATTPPIAPYGSTFQRILSDIRSADFSAPRNGSVFWTGFREGNQARAMTWAASRGKVTIEMTPGGKMLESLNLYGPNSIVSVAEADHLWRAASAKFARSASGQVTAFTSGAAFDRAKVFYGLELPKLMANPQVNRSVIYR